MFVFDIPHILLYTLILLYCVCMPNILKKVNAARKNEEGYQEVNPTLGYIPGYNFFLLITKVLQKPWWWILLLLIPGVNFLMLIILNVNLSFCFNKRSFKDALIAIIVPHYIVGKVAFEKPEHKEIRYVGPLVWKNKKEKGLIREWGDALLFAIIAASIIRTFLFEAFTIPTGSMEKDLLIGDYLFVNKIAYGPRVPQTPLSVPFFHNTIPGTYTKSYLEWFKLGYHRLPGYSSVKRNDIVVFNYPTGDTTLLGKNHSDGSEMQGHNYYQFVRNEALILAGSMENLEADPATYLNQARKNILEKNRTVQGDLKGWTTRPTDKKENYIKRCVAIPGDTIDVKDAVLYINGKVAYEDENVQFMYLADEAYFQPKKLKEKFDINRNECGYTMDGKPLMFIPNNKLTEVQRYTQAKNLRKDIKPMGYKDANTGYLEIFPNHPISKDWTRDNLGPIYLPKRGETIQLTKENWPIYRRAIEVYENNTVKVNGDTYFINGKPATEYTFKMGYYWMMGDNRHNSIDSRMWGYVPEDHIVGKAGFIWYSKDSDPNYGGVRWDRIFQSAH